MINWQQSSFIAMHSFRLSALRLWLLPVLLLVNSATALSEPDFPSDELLFFPNDELRSRYIALNEELRCPKCQNQNLADSNSMIAEDLRKEVRRLLLEGQSDRQIKGYLVERYGDFVLYDPPVKSSTWLLWLSPAALLLIVVTVPLLLARRNKKQQAVQPDPEAEQKLAQLLSDTSDGDQP